jgi:hypothetical protein
VIRDPIILKTEKALTNTTSEDFSISVVETVNVVCYDRVTAVNYDHAPTLITLGFKFGANEYLVESFVPTVAGQVASTQSRIFVPGNYKPFVRVVGGTAKDRIGLFVYGYISDREY